MPLYIEQSGDVDRCYRCLTDSQTLKDRATQLFTKYKSGALVTQFFAITPGSVELKGHALKYDIFPIMTRFQP